MYRQGDVLIIPEPGALRGERLPREGGRVILAHGEVTGHAHAIASPDAMLLRAMTEAGEESRLLAVKNKGVALEHEEHDAIFLKPGLYRVVRQREFEPSMEEGRFVLD